MRRRNVCFSILVAMMIVLMVAGGALGGRGGRSVGPNGVPLYVIIEVEWNEGDYEASWTVWGPVWEPVIGGTLLTSCTDCLAFDYSFTFHANGKSVHFEEVMVPTVNANPQARHIVLFDPDGDNTYVGSLASWNYFPWWDADNASTALYFDRLDYEITFDEDGNLVHFYYCQYEHKKLK